MTGSLKVWDGTAWQYVAETGPPGDTFTAAELLALLLTVDGSGSGLDADKLDGVDGADYVTRTGSGTLTVTWDKVSVDGELSAATPAGAALEVNDGRTYLQDAAGAFLAADSGELDLASASGPGWHVDDPEGTLRPLHDANNDIGTPLRRARDLYLSGTVNLAGTPLGDAATKNTGTAAGTVAAGNDSRLTDSRPPSGAAGGALAGTYPNPSLADAELTALAGTTSAADAIPYYTGAGTASTFTSAAFMRDLMSNADARTARWNLAVNTLNAVVVAVTNQTLSGVPTIDGITCSAGDLVLLTAQTAGAENGLWVVASGAWSRPTHYPSNQFVGQRTCYVQTGFLYGQSTWVFGQQIVAQIDVGATTWRCADAPNFKGQITPIAYAPQASGEYSTAAGNGVAGAPGANNEAAFPIWFSETWTCTAVTINVSTLVGTTNVRVGVRADAGLSPHLIYPGSLIQEFGSLNTSTGQATGDRTITGITQVFQAYRVYWLTTVSQGGSPSILTWNAVPWTMLRTSSSIVRGYAQTGVSGALPGSFSASKSPAVNVGYVLVGKA